MSYGKGMPAMTKRAQTMPDALFGLSVIIIFPYFFD